MIHFLMLVSRQGKVRLTKWFSQVSCFHQPIADDPRSPQSMQMSSKERTRAMREISATVLSRAPKMCNFIVWQDLKATSLPILTLQRP